MHHQPCALSLTASVCVEDMVGEVIVPPARKLEDLIRLADLCVDLLRQNEEFYAEVSLTQLLPKAGFCRVIN
jgi:hypothetical protein